jgi:hypothetical protein
MVSAPVSDEPGWSSGVIEPAPIPFEPVEPTLPRFEAMLPVTSVLNKGYPRIIAGGGIQQLPIAKAAPPLLALEANEKLGFAPDLRTYGVGAQILHNLGVKKMRLVTNNPRKISGLKGFGIEIVQRLPLLIETNEYNSRYLGTKAEKLGHLIPYSN